MWESIKLTLEKLDFNLIIGWFLGITSTLFVDKIQKWSKKKDIRKGINAEVKQIRSYALSFNFLLTLETDSVTEEWAKWMKPHFEELISSGEYSFYLDKPDVLKPLLGQTDELFVQGMKLMATLKKTKPQKTDLSMAKLNISYIESKFDSLSLFPMDFQLLVTKFRREVDLINFDAEQAWYYHTKTFDDLKNNNHDIVVMNINNIIKRTVNRTKALIRLCDMILD